MHRLVGRWTVTSTMLGATAVLAVALYSSVGEARAPQGARARVDFETQVKPILAANCLACHGADTRKGGLSLAEYADVLEGGKNGAVVRPGQAGKSVLLSRVNGDPEFGDRMPLGETPLTGAQIATIRTWIDQGARLTPSSPPAPPPWDAPLALSAPVIPPSVWASWNRPADRLVAAYLAKSKVPQPALVSDAQFARRAYLDIWGLLPSREQLQAFLADTAPGKRDRLVTALLADNTKYAEHWISFWNDLLRNDDGYTYFSDAEGGARQSITPYLLPALTRNTPYDELLARLINPSQPGDPAGFVVGVNWRGETSAAVKPWMQAAQNTAQAFLGVNFKCNACHNSFINKWTLKDAYALAAYFSPEPALQLYRCDIARDEFTGPAFLFPELARPAPSTSLPDRRATLAGIFTDPRNGRMPRTLVNRVWTKLLGRGIVANSDEMDGRPWSPELLDWLAADFVAHRYDVKHLIATIVTSRAYQMAAVPRTADRPGRGYDFRGPEIRRLSAEQFADAIGSITGEWSVYNPPGGPGGGGGRGPRSDSDAVTSGVYAREFRAPSTLLTRALGRPIRDQVTSVRAQDATTLQALELVNGEILTNRLMRAARRMVGELPPDPKSLFNAAVAGRYAQARLMDADISSASTIYLIVADTGSNAPERVLPVWANLQLIATDGTAVPVSSLTPIDASGLRGTAAAANRLQVKHDSRVVYDIAGRGFTRLRGSLDVENDRAEIGSTLNPALRFFVFAAEPNMNRLLPPSPDVPMPAAVPVTTVTAVVDRIFWSALGRAPSVVERRTAEAAIADPGRPEKPLAAAVADLLWAVLMKPEFQLVY